MVPFAVVRLCLLSSFKTKGSELKPKQILQAYLYLFTEPSNPGGPLTASPLPPQRTDTIYVSLCANDDQHS